MCTIILCIAFVIIILSDFVVRWLHWNSNLLGVCTRLLPWALFHVFGNETFFCLRNNFRSGVYCRHCVYAVNGYAYRYAQIYIGQIVYGQHAYRMCTFVSIDSVSSKCFAQTVAADSTSNFTTCSIMLLLLLLRLMCLRSYTGQAAAML